MKLIQETYLEYTKDLETHLFSFLFILDQIICVAGLLSSRSELKITSMYVCMYVWKVSTGMLENGAPIDFVNNALGVADE